MPQRAPLSVCLFLRAQLLCSLVDLCVLPCRPLCAPLSTSVCSLVNLCVLPCRPLCAPLSTSACSLVDLCVLPCQPLCAPLSTSVCSLVDLCVLPCRPLCAPLSTSVCSLVNLCVLPCHPVSMFGRGSSWTLDVETTAVFLIYRQTMTSKMCHHDRVSCVCVFCRSSYYYVVINIKELSQCK